MSVVNSLSHFARFVSLFMSFYTFWGSWTFCLVCFSFLCHFIHFGAVGHFARCVSCFFYVILYILGQLDIGSVFLLFCYVMLYILGQLDILRDLSIWLFEVLILPVSESFPPGIASSPLPLFPVNCTPFSPPPPW